MTVEDLANLLNCFSKDITIKFYDCDQNKYLYFGGIGYNGDENMNTKVAKECIMYLREKNID